MFLPNDLTPDEKTLAAEVARTKLAAHPEATGQERQQLRWDAEQEAAELIWEARAAHSSSSSAATIQAGMPDSYWDEKEADDDPAWQMERRERAREALILAGLDPDQVTLEEDRDQSR